MPQSVPDVTRQPISVYWIGRTINTDRGIVPSIPPHRTRRPEPLERGVSYLRSPATAASPSGSLRESPALASAPRPPGAIVGRIGTDASVCVMSVGADALYQYLDPLHYTLLATLRTLHAQACWRDAVPPGCRWCGRRSRGDGRRTCGAAPLLAQHAPSAPPRHPPGRDAGGRAHPRRGGGHRTLWVPQRHPVLAMDVLLYRSRAHPRDRRAGRHARSPARAWARRALPTSIGLHHG